jgi:hypothetical protein
VRGFSDCDGFYGCACGVSPTDDGQEPITLAKSPQGQWMDALGTSQLIGVPSCHEALPRRGFCAIRPTPDQQTPDQHQCEILD